MVYNILIMMKLVKFILIITTLIIAIPLYCLLSNIPLPHSFFQFLRFVMFPSFLLIICLIYRTVGSLKKFLEGYCWFPFLPLAILFNPIIPFHLDREIWSVIDLFSFVGLLFLVFYFEDSFICKGEKG